MEQYIDEYLRNIFGETLLEDKKSGAAASTVRLKKVPQPPSTGTAQKIGTIVGGTAGLVKRGVEKVGSGVGKAASTVGKISTKHPLAVGAMALGAGALAYKRYLSAAARACAQYVGTKKTECMQKYRAGGMRAEVLSLKENCIICLEAPDKELCLELVKLRISELRQEIKKLK